MAAIAAVVTVLIVAWLLFQTGNLAFEDPSQQTYTTAQNLYLEPRATEDMNHPIMKGQVVEINIEPNAGGEPVPDYELLLTVTDPSGQTIMNKFIKEPYHVKFLPSHPGWHAIVITNVGETGIATGANVVSHPYDENVDGHAEIAISCIVPPSLRTENNTPFPWC